MNGLKVAWTVEDSAIALRAIERGQTAILASMVLDDDTDAHKFFSHEEGKALDLHYAQEEFHAWQESCREDDEYYEEFGDDIDF